MGNVPELFNLLGVKSDALNDASFGGSLNTLLATIKNGDTSHKDQAVEGGEGDGTSEPAQASTPEVVSGSSSEQATEPSPVTNETIQQTDQESEADRANHEKGSIS